jgi:hypothetical protein
VFGGLQLNRRLRAVGEKLAGAGQTALLRTGIAALCFAALPVCGQAALSAASRVGPKGIGPIVIGTTPGQAAATGTHFSATAPAAGSTCFYLRPTTPAGLSLLVEDGTVRRAEVASPKLVTTDGFRVGDSLAKIKAFYGPRAHLSPGKYDSHAQTVTIDPKGNADAKFRFVFALRDGVVQTVYAGALPQVAYVEGCS